MKKILFYFIISFWKLNFRKRCIKIILNRFSFIRFVIR